MAAGSIPALLAWFSCTGAEAEEQAKADVVLRNGKIYTADETRTIKQAIAFKANTIVAVGSEADVTPLIGSGTKVIDLGGKLVLPGFIDTHSHPIVGAAIATSIRRAASTTLAQPLSAAATGTSPLTIPFAPFKPPSRGPETRDSVRSILMSGFR
jgi:imidazolonepropionase-like amidohydrolase